MKLFVCKHIMQLQVLALALFLSGCSSKITPADNFYLLDQTSVDSTATSKPDAATKLTGKPILIAIKTETLPAFLSQPYLVLQTAPHQLSFARYHRWADSLAATAKRALIRQLNKRGSQYRFVGECNDCPTISLSIEHFYPTWKGDVRLAGFYRLPPSQGEHQSLPVFFSLTAAMANDGYHESVKTMAKLLEQLARTMFSRLLSASSPMNQ